MVWRESRMSKLLRPLPAAETLAHVLPIPVAVPVVLVSKTMPVTIPAMAVAKSRMIKALPKAALRPARGPVLHGTTELAALGGMKALATMRVRGSKLLTARCVRLRTMTAKAMPVTTTPHAALPLPSLIRTSTVPTLPTLVR